MIWLLRARRSARAAIRGRPSTTSTFTSRSVTSAIRRMGSSRSPSPSATTRCSPARPGKSSRAAPRRATTSYAIRSRPNLQQSRSVPAASSHEAPISSTWWPRTTRAESGLRDGRPIVTSRTGTGGGRCCRIWEPRAPWLWRPVPPLVSTSSRRMPSGRSTPADGTSSTTTACGEAGGKSKISSPRRTRQCRSWRATQRNWTSSPCGTMAPS